jgi:type IV pilus assembly protein PilV
VREHQAGNYGAIIFANKLEKKITVVQRKTKHRTTKLRIRTQGFTLVELLVALVVMTVGMLGVAVLFVEGLQINRTSAYRTTAVGLASDMADRIRTNINAQNAYGGNGPGADNACVNGPANCGRDALASDDWFWWLQDVNTHLPAGATADILVTPIATPALPMIRYDITLQWPEAGQAAPVSYTLTVQH